MPHAPQRAAPSALLLALAVLNVLILAGCAPAQQKQLKSAPERATERESASTNLPRVKASNLLDLRKLEGKEIVAYGRVERLGKSSSGHRFLNFAGGQLTGICRSNHVSRFQGDHNLDGFRGKDVELTGVLETYKGKLQISLESPDQIRVASGVPDSLGAPRAVLKQIGKDVWMSPAGLKYSGRDPQGLTRVEHIMRHAKDDPQRDGPHGVFVPGTQDAVFGWIDLAWKRAHARNQQPHREGARSTYTITMDRTVGYLGGQVGLRKGRPKLQRIFIVFESGSKNIITAFPK